MSNFNYTNLTPFKWFVLENFPFIEADFDALTEWQLFCKLGKEINKIIDSENILGTQVETLTNYINNYFDNLDVQDEINNKLNDMAEQGTLQEILNETLFSTYNERVSLLESKNTLIMGDSYAVGANPNNDNLTSWATILKNLLELENNQCEIIAEAGAGFLRAGIYNHTFLQLLQSQISTITNKNMIKNIILCGGYNDNTYTLNDIRSAIMNFVDYCKTQFPNATVYIGCIGYRMEISSEGGNIRGNIAQAVYPAYANNISVNLKNYVYLNGVENILKSNPTTYMYVNNAHPNQAGQNALGQGIYQAFKGGIVKNYSNNTFQLTNENATNITSSINSRKCDNMYQISVADIKVDFAEETGFTIAVGSLVDIADYQVNNFIGGINNDFNIAPCTVSIQDYDKGRHTMSGYIMFDRTGKLKLFTWHTINTSNSGQSLQFNKVKQIQVFRCKCEMPLLVS